MLISHFIVINFLSLYFHKKMFFCPLFCIKILFVLLTCHSTEHLHYYGCRTAVHLLRTIYTRLEQHGQFNFQTIWLCVRRYPVRAPYRPLKGLLYTGRPNILCHCRIYKVVRVTNAIINTFSLFHCASSIDKRTYNVFKGCVYNMKCAPCLRAHIFNLY